MVCASTRFGAVRDGSAGYLAEIDARKIDGVKSAVKILIADDDEGHVGLVRRNLHRAGITNAIESFRDGKEIMDFLEGNGDGPHCQTGTPYLLLLDIRMPYMDGTEVLERLKTDQRLRKLPVVMLTTTDDPREIARCHELGCNAYITKPVDYQAFVDVVRKLGLFLTIVEFPSLEVGDEKTV